MGRTELEALIDRAVRPDVPLRVLFAALDRYTELLRPPVAEDFSAAPAPVGPETQAPGGQGHGPPGAAGRA
jgi:hypothetical protein